MCTFVHVSKTGGETLITLLGLPKDHRPARERPRSADGEWRFAVVRNPWDRLVSWYFHLRRHLQPPAEVERHTSALGRRAPCYLMARRRVKMNPAEHRILAENLPFRPWVAAVLNQPALYAEPGWGPCGLQVDMLYDADRSTLLVDDVFRFEDGYAEVVLPAVLRRLGREDLVPRIAVTNNSGPPRPHYSAFYEGDDAVIREVGRHFAPDVQAFGYAFETPQKEI